VSRIYLVRHPETTVDLSVPSDQWALSPAGLEQAQLLAKQPFWRPVGMIYSSEEPKATATARIVAARTGLPWQTRACLGELDRSAFQPPDIAAYRSAVARMFGTPFQQVLGWESRAHAEERIVTCVQQIADKARGGDIAIVSHGLILTLLIAHLDALLEPFDFWRSIGFADVAVLESEGWELVEPFNGALQP